MNYDLVDDEEGSEGSIDSIEETVQEEDESTEDCSVVFNEEEATANLLKEATEMFIDGKWDSFDYSILERSDEFVDFKQLELDEQQIYFDDEE